MKERQRDSTPQEEFDCCDLFPGSRIYDHLPWPHEPDLRVVLLPLNFLNPVFLPHRLFGWW